MEPPPPPPLPLIAASKLRLMCSYGGHIVPRPHDKVLFYAGGESRIVSVERRTTAGSLSVFCAHLSRTVFNNRPFHLKYQLPNEELDSLISVITDEDLANMIEENDRIAPPGRIRLFLFPIKPEPIGSALLDPKSETWFSDALESTRILQKGQSGDSGLLMGVGLDLEAQVETGSNGGEGKVGPESLVLETCSSFGSTSSLLSVTNSPTIGINHGDEKGLNLFDGKIRVPSPASIESEISVGNLAAPLKFGILPEPLIPVGLEESPENPFSDPSYNITTQKPVQILGYPPLSQLPDIKKQQPETQLIQGPLQYPPLSQLPDIKKQQPETPLVQAPLQYVPQYTTPMPISPYYPVYQMPIHPPHISCPPTQPYPVYVVPVRPTQQYPNVSMPVDANITSSTIRPPLHPQAAVITQPLAAHKEVFGPQIAESAVKAYCSIPAPTQLVNIPSHQRQLVRGPLERHIASEPIMTASVVPAIQGNEFDEDIAYNAVYKTQPIPPVLPSQYQAVAKGTMMLPEPSVKVQQPKRHILNIPLNDEKF